MFDLSSYMKLGRKPRLSLQVKRLMHSISYLLVFTAVLSFASSMFFKTSSPVGTITSESMAPILGVGDIIFIQPSRIEDVRVGEIVAFHATPKTVVIHRVEKVMLLPGKIYLITKGDANDVTDQSVGFPPVRKENFLGKVLNIDGIPVKIPLVGLLWLQIYNFSIWLTQDKPWSLWAPLLAALYICWPTLSKGKKIYQKHFARSKVDKRQIFAVAFVAFFAISLFTLWFRVEQYSLGLRVASLLDFPTKHNFNYGSMIYGQKQDNRISITGAPMFPVKAVSLVKGNASILSSVIPKSSIIQPNVYFDLNLHTEVPARGQIRPGLYEGIVYIFSSSLWTLLPDEAIFQVFNVFPDPWVSAVILELLGAFALASSITVLFLSLELLVKQATYTYVWLRHLPEQGMPPRYLLLLRRTRLKIRHSIESLNDRIKGVAHAFSVEGRIPNLKASLAIAAISYAAYFVAHSLILSVLLQCLLSSLYAISRRLRQREALVGTTLTHMAYSSILISHNAISSLYSVNGPWSLAATSFTGLLVIILTTPAVFAIFLLVSRILMALKIWGLEHETLGWAAFRRVKFVWPTFEKATVEIIPRKIEVWTYSLSRRISTLVKPRRLVAESCRVIKPLEIKLKALGKLNVESYVSPPKGFFEKLEESLGLRKRILTVEEYWIGTISKSNSFKGGNV